MPKTKILTYAGIGSAALLAGLPVFLSLAPIFSVGKASAIEEETVNADDSVTLSITPTIAITAENLKVSATPTIGKNTFITTKATVNVKNTGSSGGYHLIMSSNNGGALKNGNKSINTFSEYSKTGADMQKAKSSSWGYTLQTVSGTNSNPATDTESDLSNVYLPIPTSSTSWNETADQDTRRYAYLKNTTKYSDMKDGDNIAISYAFAVGTDTTVGAYTDTITYTAIPNEDNSTIADFTNMQDLALYRLACHNTTKPTAAESPASKSLVDNRANKKSYTIKKLADGNCWMTDNLALPGGAALTPEDSNIAEDYTLPESSKSGFSSTDTDSVYTGDSNYGGYYSHVVATAGSTKSSGVADYDICPKGWRLPTKDEFDNLKIVYDLSDKDTWAASPFNGKAAGVYFGGSLYDGGSTGVYWSSSFYIGSACYLRFDSGSSHTGVDVRYNGFSVRCLSEGND